MSIITKPKPARVLILGGTLDARSLALALSSNHQLDITTSLAGRTQQPEKIAGKVRIGGFGGVAGLTRYLVNEKINLLIDATHPFATRISENAQKTSRATGIPLLYFERSEWEKQARDNWIDCASPEEAAKKLPASSKAFLALGSQYLNPFSCRHDVQFIARIMSDSKFETLLPNCRFVIGKPANRTEKEVALFESHAITHLVCRNSGGTPSYAKVAAARQLELPVLMVRHPQWAKPKNGFSDIRKLITTITRFSC